jgi:hypothetical protein
MIHLSPFYRLEKIKIKSEKFVIIINRGYTKQGGSQFSSLYFKNLININEKRGQHKNNMTKSFYTLYLSRYKSLNSINLLRNSWFSPSLINRQISSTRSFIPKIPLPASKISNLNSSPSIPLLRNNLVAFNRFKSNPDPIIESYQGLIRQGKEINRKENNSFNANSYLNSQIVATHKNYSSKISPKISKKSKNWRNLWINKFKRITSLGKYQVDTFDRLLLSYLKERKINMLNKDTFNTFLAINKEVNYTFMKINTKKVTLKSLYKLLKSFFKSLKSFISYPILNFTPNKLIINLFYYVKPTRAKIKEHKILQKYIRKDGKLFKDNLLRSKFSKVKQNLKILLFFKKWKVMSNNILLPNIINKPFSLSMPLDYRTLKLDNINPTASLFVLNTEKEIKKLETDLINNLNIWLETFLRLQSIISLFKQLKSYKIELIKKEKEEKDNIKQNRSDRLFASQSKEATDATISICSEKGKDYYPTLLNKSIVREKLKPSSEQILYGFNHSSKEYILNPLLEKINEVYDDCTAESTLALASNPSSAVTLNSKFKILEVTSSSAVAYQINSELCRLEGIINLRLENLEKLLNFSDCKKKNNFSAFSLKKTNNINPEVGTVINISFISLVELYEKLISLQINNLPEDGLLLNPETGVSVEMERDFKFIKNMTFRNLNQTDKKDILIKTRKGLNEILILIKEQENELLDGSIINNSNTNANKNVIILIISTLYDLYRASLRLSFSIMSELEKDVYSIKDNQKILTNNNSKPKIRNISTYWKGADQSLFYPHKPYTIDQVDKIRDISEAYLKFNSLKLANKKVISKNQTNIKKESLNRSISIFQDVSALPTSYYLKNLSAALGKSKGSILRINPIKSNNINLNHPVTSLSKDVISNLKKLKIPTIVSLNLYKFKFLIFFLEKVFNKPIELNLIRLKYPYHESNILAQVLALSSKKYKFFLIMKKLLYTANIKHPGKEAGINNDTFKDIPSYLSGIKVKLAGRILTERLVPRQTVKNFQVGSLSRGKVDFKTTSRITLKNKRGSYSFTVTTSHILDNYTKSSKRF